MLQTYYLVTDYEDGVWYAASAVDPDSRTDLADYCGSGDAYFVRNGRWIVAQVGPVIEWEGDYGGKWYRGPALLPDPHSEYHNYCIPVENIPIGAWAAISQGNDIWQIEPGLKVRTIGGPLYPKEYDFAPAGRGVFTILKNNERFITPLGHLQPVSQQVLGKVAFDLAAPPLRRDLQYFDGEKFLNNDHFEIHWLENTDLTREFMGFIDYRLWFWFMG